MENLMPTIEIAYASADKQFLLSITLPKSCSVQQAIESSGILEQCPEIDFSYNKIGIFGKTVALKTLVKDNDRIEIYRPLLLNPMQARRLRAEKKI